VVEEKDLEWISDIKDKKIVQLREQVNKRDVAIEHLHAEIMNLRDENSGLAEERVKNDRVIENQKYQLGKYAEELERLQEEIQSLKVFAKRYLEV
jgi:archaellum component FlaC